MVKAFFFTNKNQIISKNYSDFSSKKILDYLILFLRLRTPLKEAKSTCEKEFVE